MRIDTLFYFKDNDISKLIEVTNWINCHFFGEMIEDTFKRKGYEFCLDEGEDSLYIMLKPEDLLVLEDICYTMSNQKGRLPFKESIVDFNRSAEKIHSLLNTETENRKFMFTTRKIPLG